MPLGRQLTLGGLIEALEREKPAAIVYYDFASVCPTDVDSYRGDYEQLALGYGLGGRGPTKAPTVAELLERLKTAVGAEYDGWKGGTYTMRATTPMWAANAGDATGTKIVGVVGDGYRVRLLTATEYDA